MRAAVVALAVALGACDMAVETPDDACTVRLPARHVPYTPSDEPVRGPAAPTPGFLHAEGARLVDHQGRPVRLTGLNWFGLETSALAPAGLDRRSLGSLLDQVVRLGFNTLRVPFASELLDDGAAPAPGAIDPDHNPDLVGLDALALLDRLVAEAGARGLRVILDRHTFAATERGAARRGCAKDGPWYTEGYGELRWIRDWQALAERYRGDSTVIGFDLSNEPDATWGDDAPATDWRLAAERAGNAILAIHPELLIIVQGVTDDPALAQLTTWAGGNLAGARAAPIRLALPGQLVYSAHDYPATVAPQPWFADPTFPDNLPDLWDDAWGYLLSDGLAPVLIGEYGTRLETAQDRQWLDALLAYADARGASTMLWCLNPESRDTGGLLLDDWRTVRTPLYDAVAPHLAPMLW